MPLKYSQVPPDTYDLELTNADAAIYLCGNEPIGGVHDDYGTYYATLFRFKIRGSGILGLLWTRENGNWRIVSYRVFPH